MTRLRYLVVLAIFVCVAALQAGAQESQRPGFTPTVPAQYAATAFGQSGSLAGKASASPFASNRSPARARWTSSSPFSNRKARTAW